MRNLVGLAVFALSFAYLCLSTDAQPTPDPKRVSQEVIDIAVQPFAEEKAFPLADLIALKRDAELHTARGRCKTLIVNGKDVAAHCESRLGLTFGTDDEIVYWFTMGTEAIGFSGQINPSPENRVLIVTLKQLYYFSPGQIKIGEAHGECRFDLYLTTCKSSGPVADVIAEFEGLGGSTTMQFPVEYHIFDIPQSEISSARGQCNELNFAGSDMTPYCASFITQAVLDKTSARMNFFTVADHVVIGFYGLLKDEVKENDGTITIPITSTMRINKNHAGTAPAQGSCREKYDGGRRLSVECRVITTRENATISASFTASQSLSPAVRLNP